MVLLLLTGRCYEAEICDILLLLRFPFRWNRFLSKSKFWPKTMDGVLAEIELILWSFYYASWKKVLRKVCHSKGNEKRNLMVFVSVA